MFFFELCFGQFASLGHVAIWIVNPLFKGNKNSKTESMNKYVDSFVVWKVDMIR